LDLLMEGKGRHIAAALKLQTLELSPDQRSRLETLRAAIREQTTAMAAAHGIELGRALDNLATTRRQLLELIESAGSAEKSAGGALALARKLVPAGGAIAAPIITDVGGKLLIVAASNDGQALSVIDLPALTRWRLTELMLMPAGDRKLDGWIGAYVLNDRLGDVLQQITDNWWSERTKVAELEEQYRQVEKQWHEAITDLGHTLWQLIGRDLDQALKARGLRDGAALLWLPTGALGLVPIGLAQDRVSGRRLGETYQIAYAPSLSALKAATDQLKAASSRSLAEVINPTEDLPSTEIEGTLVATYFKPEVIT